MQPEEQALEDLLRQAASDPAARPDFYAKLLEAKIYVIGTPNAGEAGTREMQPGEDLQLVAWGKPDGSPIVPFFSSLAALQAALTEPSSYFALEARAFFEITQGSDLVLNPKSDHGKEFTPTEIEALMTDGMNHLGETRVVDAPTEVLLGQPAHYPTAMVDALSDFLAKRPDARAGYLCLMHDRSRDERPHLVIGIEADDAEPLIKQVGSIAADLAPSGDPVDVVAVVKGEAGLSDYFLREVKPFYRRKAGGLKGLFRLK